VGVGWDRAPEPRVALEAPGAWRDADGHGVARIAGGRIPACHRGVCLRGQCPDGGSPETIARHATGEAGSLHRGSHQPNPGCRGKRHPVHGDAPPSHQIFGSGYRSCLSAWPAPGEARKGCMSAVQGRILIADDDREMAQLLGHLFYREGLTPLLAKDGAEAVQLVHGGDPDVLLADLMMPGMDGMELMRKAKELDPDLPVILITGYAEMQGAVQAIRAGAHDYLAKPFDNRAVIRVVLRALNERRLKLELKRLADHVHNV